jgi:hypothetical protein
MNMEQWWNDIFAGETEELGENLPSATLSTTNPTWIDPGANPGLRGERPATNRMSHGTACPMSKLSICGSEWIMNVGNRIDAQSFRAYHQRCGFGSPSKYKGRQVPLRFACQWELLGTNGI